MRKIQLFIKNKIFNDVLEVLGFGIIVFGFFMFKDIAIEHIELTKHLFGKYWMDLISGIILILIGIGMFNFGDKNRHKK